MRILVTGGRGYVGRAIVAFAQAAGYRVETLGLHRGDYCVDLGHAPISQIRRALRKSDAVVHAAGSKAGPPAKVDEVNVRGTARLLEAAAGEVGRVVYISSTGCYGNPRGAVTDETTLAKPRNVYEKTKWQAEAHVLAIGRTALLSTASLQPSTVLGGPNPSSLLERLTAVARRGLPLPGCAPGAILNVVDVRAVAEAAVSLVGVSHHGPFIVSQPVSWSLVYQLIEEHVARPVHRLPACFNRPLGLVGDQISALPFSSTAAEALRSTTTFCSARARKLSLYEPAPTVSLISSSLGSG